MHILDALKSYESWMAENVTYVQEDLKVKHVQMSISPFHFLRATYFRWAQRVFKVCKNIKKVPKVLSVGDLHIENFGTWRDQEGRLVWGINDFDEASKLPFTNDLLRLAVSAYLAIDGNHLKLDKQEASAAILKGYTKALETGGEPFVLEERNAWLRDIALSKLKEPVRFWSNFENLPPVNGPIPEDIEQLLRNALPLNHKEIKISKRISGLGSLGLQKYLILGKWEGGYVCREIKPLIPSVQCWLNPDLSLDNFVKPAITQAIRCPDPFLFLSPRWIIRRLSPHCSKINLNTMPETRDELKLLKAMGYETANIHLGSQKRNEIKNALQALPKNWLHESSLKMRKSVKHDYKEFISQRK